MNLFIVTLFITFPLFFCAALLFNSCRKRIRKTSHGGCHQSGGGAGCSCSAAAQQIIQSADKIR